MEYGNQVMDSIAILVIEKGRARVMRFRVELTGEANWSLACHSAAEALQRLRPDLITVVESENRARWLAEELRRQGRADAVILLHPESEITTPGQTHVSLPGEIDPAKPKEFFMHLAAALLDAQSKEPANPLTGLPGAGVLRAEVERRLAAGEPFVFLYIDLDNFKPFNDYYGFARGDDVIRMLARQMREVVREHGDITDMCIHIGGDDFAILTEPARADAIATSLIQHFEAAVPTLYDDTDRQQGFIVTHDRRGNPEKFPLMTITVAGVSSSRRKIEGYLQLSEIAAEVKSFAKKSPASNYVLDRRRDSQGEG